MRLLTLGSLLLLAVTSHAAKHKQCKCFPGDECWPSERDWAKLNTTVGGRLIKTIPLGSPCHDPHYDAARCEALKAEWKLAPIHIDSSSSVQAAIFANASCDVFTPQSSACMLGNYVRYAVNVTGPDDIAATIRFATKNNIRLVIRNTGHDYMGRSTGAGSLGIWTHHLKGVEVKDWSDPEYTGKAVKIAAGAQGWEVGEAARAAGLVVVTGECPTVGVAGGYTQSGGHSPLSSTFGLSADNTLEFEVVTAEGRFVTATPYNKHADLFWALSGSGSGNFGVAVSVTLRAHPDTITSGASFALTDPSLDYAAVLAAFHASLSSIVDAGTQVTYYALSNTLVVHSISAYNRTQADLEHALSPFLTTMLTTFNTTLHPTYTQFTSYHSHYLHYYGPLPAGIFGGAGTQLMGGRLLPRRLLSTPRLISALTSTLHLGVQFIGQAQNVTLFSRPKIRAVLPQWRDSLVMSAYSLPYSTDVAFSEMEARQDFITEKVMPLVEAATPGAGAYINEADFQQRDWQEVFYGANYGRLGEVKRRYDPRGVFWNAIAVGSEGWKVRGDGRLCEV